ncbi:sensor histidine kinase [Paenibacillus sp. YN15]|uniref:sensor histidine kinase n=1 Tax=Paenibacillus sp. YN15 TaxID=1742774 RepID=UPI000DCDB988|nr:histidine kinase [Paenibacillus sp. YN15]RAV05123.1 hypothetical protein DQG13_04400 [Paenibacillus sp. YN15]
MTTFRKTKTFMRFMVKNGILTLATSLIIVLAIRAILHEKERGWLEYVPIFLFVVMIITLFFFIIYWQSHKLRSEQELLSNVFKHSPDGILVLDHTLNIVRMNPVAGQMMQIGDEPAALSFCNFCSNYPGLHKLCSYQNCFITEPGAQVMTLQLTTPSGRKKSINASLSQYQDPIYGPLNIIRMQEVEERRQEEQNRIAKMITHSILSAQENERKRISRELHDGIGQSLYSILIQTEIIKASLESEENSAADEPMSALQESIRHTIEDIRDLSAELRPSALDDIGLAAALRNYVRLYRQKFGIQVLFTIEGDSGRLPAAHEIALYRIVQEALTNAAKYSQTEVVDVSLKLLPLYTELHIRDYGTGFVITAELRQGVGLYSMEERVNILGGEFAIESAPGQGTVIQVKVPIGERQAR